MWYNPSTMSTDFNQLIEDIELEAEHEGPQAVRELEQCRQEFSLAIQLIESRREGKLSQRDLASLSGIPQSEISRIETGASNPTYATISALLGALGKRVQLVDAHSPVAAAGRRSVRSAKAGSASRKASKVGKFTVTKGQSRKRRAPGSIAKRAAGKSSQR
jgi:DNA-binding XRE family transcriptional regulator